MLSRHPGGVMYLVLRTGWRRTCGCLRSYSHEAIIQANREERKGMSPGIQCWIFGERRIHQRHLEGMSSKASRKPGARCLGSQTKTGIWGPILHSSIRGHPHHVPHNFAVPSYCVWAWARDLLWWVWMTQRLEVDLHGFFSPWHSLAFSRRTCSGQ